MSRLWLLLVVLVAAAATVAASGEAKVEYGEGGRRKAKLEDMPRQYPIDGNETRVLHYDYTFLSETVMYDVLENKINSPSIFINASLTFDILHHGNGDILAVYTLVECFSNNCGSPPPVWVNFRRGGNNLNEVYIDKEDVPADYQPRWNFLYAAAHTIYTPADSGEGDEQYTKTPYGMCSVFFSRPEDKRFRRQIRQCDLQGTTNTSRIDGLLATRYMQDAHYVQNTKVDADIVVIESIEELALSSQFDDKFGIVIETRSRMEMTNRTFRVVPRMCELGYDADKCATESGLIKVGDRLYEKVDLKREHEDKYQIEKLAKILVTLRGVYYDEKTFTEEHAAAFGDLLLVLKKIDGAEAIKNAFLDEANYDIKEVLATALGALGGADAVGAGRVISYDEEGTFNRFGRHFLFGLAHHTHAPSDKFLKELMYWLRDTPATSALHWDIANTIATVLHRDCERSVSARNACDKGKRPILTKFVADVTDCTEEKCVEKALEVLVNLPNAATVKFATAHLCSDSQAVQLRAAQLIAKAPTTLYDSQLTYSLVRVFRNTCPSPSSTTASMTALNAMIRFIPDSQTAGTLILRTESPADAPVDHELWAYLYDAVAVSRQFDAAKDSFWSKLRGFRVFRPNYAQRALKADSNAFGADIAEFASFRGRMRSSAEFAKGVVRGSTFAMNAVKAAGVKAPEWPLFELQVESSGLESYVDPDHSITDVTDPKATLRLSLLGHALPAFTAMMSAAMNANGRTIRVFESSLPLRTFSTFYPLLSGLSVSLDTAAVTAFRLFGSSEISLWSRDSVSEIHVNSSSAITASASLILEGTSRQRLDSKLSMITGVQSRTEAKFASKPYRFCVNMGNDAAVVSVSSLRIDDEDKEEPKVQTTRSTLTHPGHSWFLGEAMRKQCRSYFKEA